MTARDFTPGRIVAINNGEIPKTEYCMTEAITRLLWRGITEFKIEVTVGVLLSNRLNDTNSVNPLMLLKNGNHQYMQVVQ